MKTDPKNHGYIMEHGAVRQYEAWNDLKATEKVLKNLKDTEETGNVMKYIENKTFDSKREMNLLENIEDLRKLKK